MLISTVNDLPSPDASGIVVVPESLRTTGPLCVLGSLEVRGNLHVAGSVEVEGRLQVGGHAVATGAVHVVDEAIIDGGLHAGGNLRCGGGVQAGAVSSGRSIQVAGDLVATKRAITATEAILAGGAIRAAHEVQSHHQLHSGGGISAGRWVFCFAFELDCTFIENGLVPLGRAFWASQAPFAPWRDLILDTACCWDEFRAAYEAEKTAPRTEFLRSTDEDWCHWSLAGQMRNFLGITTRCYPRSGACSRPTDASGVHRSDS